MLLQLINSCPVSLFRVINENPFEVRTKADIFPTLFSVMCLCCAGILLSLSIPEVKYQFRLNYLYLMGQ